MSRSVGVVLGGLAALLLGHGGTTAFASDESRGAAIGLSLDGGVTRFFGGLSGDAHAPTYGVEVSLLGPHASGTSGQAVGGFRGYFSIDLATTTATSASTPSFPFGANKSLTLHETSLMPNVCIMADLPVQACLGIGWTQIGIVEGSTNSQSYGSYRTDLRFGRFLDDGLIAGVRAHYYSVSQTVGGDKSSFAGLAYEALLGWQWRPG